MVTFSFSRYSFFFTFLVLLFVTLAAKPISSFSFKSFDKNLNFESEIALLGDAEIFNNDSSIKMTRSSILSAGRVMYREPIRFVEGNPGKPVSFSTYFSFSISPENGDGLAFVILPKGFPSESFDGSFFGLSPGMDKRGTGFLAVEFDTLMDAKFYDPNGNHVGIDISSFVSARVRNASSINILLNSGEKLHSWISYDASSKFLEIRLSNSSNEKPYNPLISYPIDLSKMWKDEEVFVGLSSSNGNSSQTINVYSWSFWLRRVPNWMHSKPVNPQLYSDNDKPVIIHKRSDCLLRFLAGVILGAGCGALSAFVVMLIWVIFFNKRPVTPVEYSVKPNEFGYEKIKVVVQNAMKEAEK